MADNNKIPYRNHEGYADPTAYEALSAAMAAYTAAPHVDQEDIRAQRLIKAIKSMIDVAGYDLIARVQIKDRRTGRVYR